MPPREALLACAWRIVILELGSLATDESDIESDLANKRTDCEEKLNRRQLEMARSHASALIDVILETS